MAESPSPKSSHTVARHRRVQKGIDGKDRRKDRRPNSEAMQAGARTYPVPPFPKQHLAKPGKEHRLDPAPLYDAPFY